MNWGYVAFEASDETGRSLAHQGVIEIETSNRTIAEERVYERLFVEFALSREAIVRLDVSLVERKNGHWRPR